MSKRTRYSWLLTCILLSGCGAGATIHTDIERPATWRNRVLWREEKDGEAVLMAVGSCAMPRLDEQVSRMVAEAALRGAVSRFMGSLELSLIETLRDYQHNAAQSGRGDEPEDRGRAAVASEGQDESLAVNKVVQLEIVNSEIDDDVLRVIGMVSADALRAALLQSRKLSHTERAVLDEQSVRGQELLRDAMDRALAAMSEAR